MADSTFSPIAFTHKKNNYKLNAAALNFGGVDGTHSAEAIVASEGLTELLMANYTDEAGNFVEGGCVEQIFGEAAAPKKAAATKE